MFTWSFLAFWHYIISTAGIAAVVCGIAIVIAVLEPPIIDKIVPDLRKWAIVVAVIARSYVVISEKFYHDGLEEKQTEWNAALQREAANGEKAHTDAVRTVGPVPADRRVFSHDPNNRDRRK